MSSRQGSVSLNTRPGFELYKASKAALNQLMPLLLHSARRRRTYQALDLHSEVVPW